MKGDIELKVHHLFFREFASKTWVSITGIVSELVENSFDEDATKVLISILDEFISRKGPNFVEILVKPGSRSNLGRPTVDPVQNKNSFMAYVKNSLSR